MTNTLRPIVCLCSGGTGDTGQYCRFRPSLDAGWALFFAACGVKRGYEAAGSYFGDDLHYLRDLTEEAAERACRAARQARFDEKGGL